MSHQIEQKAERLAFDLNTSRPNDAANILRQELECHPREALQLIQLANQLKDRNSPDRIVIQNGNIIVRDDWNCNQVYVGRLPYQGYRRDDDCDDWRRNDDWRYGRNDDWRYGRNDDWRYGNNRNDDWRYGRNDDWRYGRNDDWRYGRNDDWRYGRNDDWRYGRNDDWRYGRNDDCYGSNRRYPDIYRTPDYFPNHRNNGGFRISGTIRF